MHTRLQCADVHGGAVWRTLGATRALGRGSPAGAHRALRRTLLIVVLLHNFTEGACMISMMENTKVHTSQWLYLMYRMCKAQSTIGAAMAVDGGGALVLQCAPDALSLSESLHGRK